MKELADRPIRIVSEAPVIHWWRLAVWGSQVRLVPPWDEHEARKLRRIAHRLVFDTLTRSGKTLFLLSMALFYLSYRHPEYYSLTTTALCVSALVSSGLVSWLFRPQVHARRSCAHHGTVGERFKSRIQITNIGRFTIHDFALREMKGGKVKWDKEWQLRCFEQLSPSESRTVDLCFTPNHRCKIQLNGLVIHSYFPGFLVRTSCKRYSPKTVYILPKRYTGSLPSIRLLASQAKTFTRGDDKASGSSPSHHYDQSRPFQLGDSPQRLDHRATARRGKPMTKVYIGEKQADSSEVYLYCDTSVADFKPWQPRPESGLALNKRLAVAVAVAEKIEAEQLGFKHIAWQDSWLEVESFDQYVEQVAMIEASRRTLMPDGLPSAGGVAIVIVDHWSEDFEERILSWRAQGSVVLIFYLCDSSERALPEFDGIYAVYD